jgi:hypothetical protein
MRIFKPSEFKLVVYCLSSFSPLSSSLYILARLRVCCVGSLRVLCSDGVKACEVCGRLRHRHVRWAFAMLCYADKVGW